MSITHIPFYPSDWLAGTRGMTDTETGVYITLISRMYEMAGPIERDDNRLHRLCGSRSKISFLKSLDYLVSKGKIIESNGCLYNEKVEKIIKEVIERSSKSKQAAQSRWDRKPNKNKDHTYADASPKHMPGACQPKPKPKPKEPNGSTPIPPRGIIGGIKTGCDSLLDEFNLVWPAYRKIRGVGTGRARKAWINARKKAAFSEIAGPLKQHILIQRKNPDTSKIPHFSTWLNESRWQDNQDHASNCPPTSDQQLDDLMAADAVHLDDLFPAKIGVSK